MVKQAEHDEPFDDRTCIEQLLADQCSCQLCQLTLLIVDVDVGVVRFIDVVADVDVHRALPTMSEVHANLYQFFFGKFAICTKLRGFTMFQDTWQPGGGLVEMKSLFCLFHGASVPLTCIVGDSIPTILQLLSKCEQKDFARKVN